MRVMVFVKATKESEAGQMPEPKMLEDMMKFIEQLVDAGVMVAGDGLKPSSEGVRVRFNGDERTVLNGPFAETRELVAGYWIWKVDSIAEAVEWVKKCPNPMLSESDIEIRPLYEMEDFGDAVTPEIEAKEAELRRRTETQ